MLLLSLVWGETVDEPAVVLPVDPNHGFEFEVVDARPRSEVVDQFRFVEADDRFGQGYVIRSADRSDRGVDPGVEEGLGVADGQVLRSGIGK